MAEEFGLIQDVGKWVLHEACREARRLADRVPTLARSTISVNVSPIEFGTPDFIEQISGTLRLTGLQPQRLKLEIVESDLMKDPDATAATLHSLKELCQAGYR